MTALLTEFQVNGLYGFRNFHLTLKDNVLIIVGENGSGKTTLLRMLFYFLSGRWQSLLQFQFSSVSAKIDKESIAVTREKLVEAFRDREHRFLGKLPPPVRDRIRSLIARGPVDRIPDELVRMSQRYGIPSQILEHEMMAYFSEARLDGDLSASPKILQVAMQKIQATMGSQILYLPTYRRIERELSSIFEGADSDDLRRYRQKQLETGQSYIELVEFGMKDVQQAVDNLVGAIRDFARENLNRLTLRYLSDVVNQTYLNVDLQAIAVVPPEVVRSVINRIDETILSAPTKEHLFEVIGALGSSTATTEHERLVYHYFSTILRFQESLQEREKPISEFCDLCSQYISDKKFIYNSSTFSFSIEAKGRTEDSGKIELADLSSGEKQIVSLFSHLYLSGTDKFFVLIDEPELSLSVPWQRRLLPDIRRGQFCAGVVAVTHSPFIYDNAMQPYAHSLEEFLVG